MEAAQRRSGCGQFGLDDSHDVGFAGGAAVRQPDFRRRIAIAAADGAHYQTSGTNGGEDRGAGGAVSAVVVPRVQALHPIDYTLPVPSAQVKTCVLFGGLFAAGQTIVREPIASRDHTEIALREFGAELQVKQRVISLQGSREADRAGSGGAERSVLGGVLSGGGTSGAGVAAADSECRVESDSFSAARFPALDRRTSAQC